MFLWVNLTEKDHLEGLVIYDYRIKMDFHQYEGGGDWINLAHDKGRSRALVKALTKLRVS